MGLPLQLALRRIDIFHGVNFSVPYVPVRPSVMTVFDLSPWKTGPARATTATRVRRRTKQLFPICSKIITPTEAIRRELHGYFGVPLSRIEAVHLAPHPDPGVPTPSEASLVLRKYSINKPFLLYLGARNPRKNLNALVAAWTRAGASVSGLSLVLAGSPDQEADNLNEREGLRVIENIPDNEIQALLSAATAFVYPSLYEGFGLPVLEAMQAGAPVVTSLDPAITEVAGGAALQVDCGSIPALSRALVDVVAQPGLRDDLRQRGLRRAAQFSWNSTAIQTHAVYEQAIRRH
jgi:alpha-1,3-rhamnosyl/mannosyltransferase